MSRRTIEADELYLSALRGQKVNYPIGVPAVAGFWKLRHPGKDSPWAAVKITEEYEVDPETDQQSSDSIYRATVNGKPVSTQELWPYAGRFPIPAADYDQMMAGATVQTQPTEQPMMFSRSEQIHELATALAKAQGMMAGAKKDVANTFFKSKYADLASVWDACREPLSANGLCVVQSPEADGVWIAVVTELLHASGQWMRSRLEMVPVKADPQGVGSAITYARRYALQAMVGIAPEDDDGEGAMGRQSKPAAVTQTVRDDDKAQRAFEYANMLAGEIDKITSPGFLAEFLSDPEHKPKIATLQANYPKAYDIVRNARERKASKLTGAAA